MIKQNFIDIKKIPKHVHFAECWLLVPKTQFCLLWPSSPCLIHFYKRCVSIWFALIIFYLSITWTYSKGWFIKYKWKPFEEPNFMIIKKIPKHVQFAECGLLVPKLNVCLSSPCLIHFFKRCVSKSFALIIFLSVYYLDLFQRLVH